MASLDADLTELLQGSQKLQAAIYDDVYLPPVSRSIHQIDAETRALTAGTNGDAGSLSVDAPTYRFLATQGIDASVLDPSSLELAVSAQAAREGGAGSTPDAWDGDVDKLLEREQQSILVQAVEQSKRLVTTDFEQAYWSSFTADWQARKPRFIAQLCARQPQAAPAPRPGARAPAVAGATPYPSRDRTARHIAYGRVFEQILTRRHPPVVGNLFDRLASAAQGAEEAAAVAGSAAKLDSYWRLLSAMASSAAHLCRPERRQTELPASEEPYESRSPALRIALLRGALHHLGAQQLEVLKQDVKNAQGEAQPGGELGTEFIAAAVLRLEKRHLVPAGGADGITVQLAPANEAPLWPLVYWCVRCGDLTAAVRAIERAPHGAAPPRLLALLQLMANTVVQNEAFDDALKQAVLDAREEFWERSQLEPYLQVIYAALAAPDPAKPLKDLLPERTRTIEDYLWYQLSMVRSHLIAPQVVRGAEGSDGGDALSALQRKMNTEFGESFFTTVPLVYFSVLLHLQQFERAVAYLYSTSDWAGEAVHFGLALQHEGLLSCGTARATDGPLLDTTRRDPLLLLRAMLERTLLEWVKHEPVDSLKYVWMMRGDESEREDLAAKLLLRSGQAAALLHNIPFIPPSSKQRLLAAVATSLKADGLLTQAAQLLYQAEHFDDLAKLLAEELSANLLVGRASAEETARAAQLRTDAAAFLAQWTAKQPEQAQQNGSNLQLLLSIAHFLELSESWRRARGGGSEQTQSSLTQMLGALHEQPLAALLPREMSQVEEVQSTFRHRLQPEVQRAFPALIEAAMEALHAKYELLKASRSAGGYGGHELQQLRGQAEALVAFAGLSLWIAAEVLGQLQLTTATSQRIASWLADMA